MIHIITIACIPGLIDDQVCAKTIYENNMYLYEDELYIFTHFMKKIDPTNLPAISGALTRKPVEITNLEDLKNNNTSFATYGVRKRDHLHISVFDYFTQPRCATVSSFVHSSDFRRRATRVPIVKGIVMGLDVWQRAKLPVATQSDAAQYALAGVSVRHVCEKR